MDNPRMLLVMNMESQIIPAFGLIRGGGIVRTDDQEPYLKGYLPNRDHQTDVFVCGPNPIASGEIGLASSIWPNSVAFVRQNAESSIGQAWGVREGSHLLWPDRVGFVVLDVEPGEISGVATVMPMTTAMSGFIVLTSSVKNGDYYPARRISWSPEEGFVEGEEVWALDANG